ncbi:hypothetical protein KY290_000678 [Solanum tuberosum]|uniref:Uncharacterized protein n=1 Tax=Solanum tuberosum TaxID=4113 RepID=A0ABQ7WM76_SOLTU|nr:hypothetical protein KY289_000741 [Solanum tuberosum]KAH0781080.1 hypothetical protein KY290_000678 [Solanum tuberosum]
MTLILTIIVTNTGDNDDPEWGVAGETSTKNAFKDSYVPPWNKQITMRAMVTGLILSVIFNFIVCELNLTTGVIPSLNVANGLLGFTEIKSWTALIQQKNIVKETFYHLSQSNLNSCIKKDDDNEVQVDVSMWNDNCIHDQLVVQWIFACDEGCGFANLHTFCSQAYAKRFYFDFSSSTYVRVVFTFNYCVGLENGGVIAELASCGLMMSILDRTSGLMGVKAGYLTLTSPRSIFFSQLIGTAMGSVITPLVFWIFNSAYRLGNPEGSYPALYALMYHGIALLRVEGFGTLPKHCLNLSICFILAAIQINLVTQLLKKFETKYRIY